MKHTACKILHVSIVLIALAFPFLAEAATVLHYRVSFGNENYRETGVQKTTWLGKECSRQDEGPVSLIVNYRTNKVSILLHGDAVYVETERPFRVQKVMPKAFFDGALSNGFTFLVEGGEEREEELYQWPCDRFRLSTLSAMAENEAEICLASGLPGVDMEKYKEIFFIERFGVQFDDEAVRELRKLRGVLISSRSTIEMSEYSVEIEIVLEAITEEPMPEDICEISEEYEQRAHLPEVL